MISFAAIAIGMLLGMASGLLSGIHSNTIASVLSEIGMEPSSFALLVVAALGAHLAFQFFPSIFLSIPDDTVVASVLPGHRLALEGKGNEALCICAFSVVLAASCSALLLPAALFILPLAYNFIEPHMALVLVGASCALLLSEKQGRKIALAMGVFLLAGALGMASLRGAINDSLFPLFSGLFASSGILLSLTATKKLPKQLDGGTELDFLPYVAAGVVAGMLSDLLPGIAAPAQIAVFASVALPAQDARKFLALISSIAASHMVFAFGALLSIGKAREGALAIVNEVSPVLLSDLPVLVGVFLLSLGVCSLLLLKLSSFAHLMQRFDTKRLNLLILGYLVCAVAIISGPLGLLLFATSTCVGLLAPLLGIRRTHVMGAIIVPSILLAL